MGRRGFPVFDPDVGYITSRMGNQWGARAGGARVHLAMYPGYVGCVLKAAVFRANREYARPVFHRILDQARRRMIFSPLMLFCVAIAAWGGAVGGGYLWKYCPGFLETSAIYAL